MLFFKPEKPEEPEAPYILKKSATRNGLTAITTVNFVHPVTGKKQVKRVTWGYLSEDLVFTPNLTFLSAPFEERARLLFPESWDISKAYDPLNDALPRLGDYCKDCSSLFYGHIFLLEQVAVKTGIWDDLLLVFSNDRKKADEILTLAIFPYVAQFSYDRLAKWQLIVKAPTSNLLTPAKIFAIAQSITDKQRIRIVETQALRHEKRLFKPPIAAWGPESVAGFLQTDTGKSLWSLQDPFFEKMRKEALALNPGLPVFDVRPGRLLIHFVTLILSSYMTYVWQSTRLKSLFSSPLELLDEMRLIKHIRYPDGSREITPFSQAQIGICQAFGFAPLKPAEQHNVGNKPFEFKRFKPVMNTPRTPIYNGAKPKPGRKKKISVDFAQNEKDAPPF
jgi:hypothetical protein